MMRIESLGKRGRWVDVVIWMAKVSGEGAFSEATYWVTGGRDLVDFAQVRGLCQSRRGILAEGERGRGRRDLGVGSSSRPKR